MAVAVFAFLAVCKILRRKVQFLLAQNQLLGQTMYQIHTIIGSGTSRDQNAVVIAGDRKSCRGGRKATQAIAQQPAVFLRPGSIHHILFSENKFHIIFSC